MTCGPVAALGASENAVYVACALRSYTSQGVFKMNKREFTLRFLLICLFAFRSVDAFGGGWSLIDAPIKLGTKSARTSYDDSLPLKSWNLSAFADSEDSCLAKMAEKEREDQRAWDIGMKAAVKATGMSEDQLRARSPRVQVPRKCLPDNDPRLR